MRTDSTVLREAMASLKSLMQERDDALDALREIVAEWTPNGYMGRTYPNQPATYGVVLAREVVEKADAL